MLSQLQLAGAIILSGLGWSVSYLVVITGVEVLTPIGHSIALAWVLKIAWSSAHTAVSRWRGLKAVTCSCG